MSKIYAYTPIPNANWNDMFYNLKFQAFTAGYTELYAYLNQAYINNLGYIKKTSEREDEISKIYKISRHNDKHPDLVNLLKSEKIVAKQARNLGVAVRYNHVQTMHLRKLVG